MVEITNNIKDFIVKKWNELFPPEEVENQTTDQVYITDGSLLPINE
ncbi:hypothetical protein IKO70_05995 [bacterium]|nr:hypothetical protein [bacterium]